MSVNENRDPLEPKLDPDMIGGGASMPKSTGYGEDADDIDDIEGYEDDGPEFSDDEVLRYLGAAKRRARNYQQIAAVKQWEESEAAFRSRHHARSRYHKDLYKGRASYFKPKSRVSVLKTLLACQSALFSTADVVSTLANDESDPVQRANAAIQKEILNYRAGNKTFKHGLPLMRTTLAARQQASVMGMCCSKQYWRYRTVTRYEDRTEDRPAMTADGTPVIDFLTGQPFMETVTETVEIIDVVEDKPVIDLIPLEMVLINPGASWIDPIQSSPDLIVQHPMFADDLLAMMDEGGDTAVKWRSVSDETMGTAVFSEDEMQGLKAAREGEGSTNSKTTKKASTIGDQSQWSGQVLDVWENFWREDGTDYHCWSLADKAILSDPVPVEDVYPAMRGQRPYVIGTDLIDPFVLYPESDVYTWQSAQNEINETTNLRMDAMRKGIFPTALVKAGKNIDLKAVQRQDASHLILIRDDNDVRYDRAPGPGPDSIRELSVLSNDFDELAGVFSQGSVQANRQLNETVGGMAMISQNANALSELKLSIFIETWMEPVISQLVALEQYYEDDTTLLAVCGKRAKLFEKFGVSEVTDELLEAQVSVMVNVGIGTADPVAKLMRFKTAWDVAGPLIAMGMKDNRLEVEFEENLNEIFALVGYKNGADRFIKVKDEGDKSVPADQVKKLMGEVQKKMQELERENADLKKGHQAKLMMKQMDLADDEKDRQLEAALAAKEFEESRREQQSDQMHDIRMKRMEAPSLPTLPTLPPMRPRFF